MSSATDVGYYIIPLLVEQPTWGGSYIAKKKSLAHDLVVEKNIGQAFELFDNAWITTDDSLNFAFATATNINQPTFSVATGQKQTLQSLIDENPVHVLGPKAIDQGWTNMQVLIKFTQAQNNSYQVHVQPGKNFGKWLPKPESWYFVERGQATLGLAKVSDVEAYKKRCVEINDFAISLSQKIKAGELELAAAKTQLKNFIDQDHPRRFVNTISVPKDAVIDLSQGGIHHSWEMSPDIPQGNIVYEVQVNVMDEFCTLRSFDQGNIKDDGSVRPLTIDDYFTALDIDEGRNMPEHYLQSTQTVVEGDAKITVLFNNQFYVSELIDFKENYKGNFTSTNVSQSFHHVFALKGNVIIITPKQKLEVQEGWSVFLPAAVGQYQLVTKNAAKVVTTHI